MSTASDTDGGAGDRSPADLGPDLLDHIARAIVSTSLPAGSHLTAASLATRFGVSRTPVREALHGLESLGLVEILGNRGAFVVDPDDIDADALRDLVGTRRLIEPAALSQAGERATAADHRRIDAALGRGDAAMADGRTGDLNLAHHELLDALSSSAHNDAVRRALRPLHYRTCLVVARTAATTLPHGWAIHRRIADHLRSGDGDAAADLHRAHLDDILSAL